jgi:hypothetical protein
MPIRPVDHGLVAASGGGAFLGHWTFLGDPNAAGGGSSYYSEGGLFQSAAQVAAGNNEHLVIARVTDSAGIAGSGVALINGLRINGNAPNSGTISYNKGFWWQYSDGVTLNSLGDIWYEDGSGNFYLAFHGYVGTTYNPPRNHSRLVKLNSSFVVQWSQAYRNTPTVNQGARSPTIGDINGDLVMTHEIHVAQASGTVKPLMGLSEVNAGSGNMASQARVVGMGFSYSADQVQPSAVIMRNKLDAGGSGTAFMCLRNYTSNTFSPGGGWSLPGNCQVVQLGEITYNSSSFSYAVLDATWYNRSASSGGRYDLTPADFDIKNNTRKTFLAANGAATSVASSATKTFGMFGEYEMGTTEGSADAWIIKCQAGGKDENMSISGMCLDLANSCFYMHGQATNVGASNAALTSTWIGKFPCSTDGIPTGSVSWINSYCTESYGTYPKGGRNGLKLTANSTITSYGWTQTATGSGTPAILSLITVPVDGTAIGGSGTVDGMAVTSHDISSYVLFQHEAASTNCDVGFSLSGTANMGLSASYSYLQTTTLGTQHDTTLVPDPTEYASGGI